MPTSVQALDELLKKESLVSNSSPVRTKGFPPGRKKNWPELHWNRTGVWVNVAIMLIGVASMIVAILFRPQDATQYEIPRAPLGQIRLNRYLFVPIYDTTPNTLSVIDAQAQPPRVVKSNFPLTKGDVTTAGAACAFTNYAGSTLYVVNNDAGGSITVIQHADNMDLMQVAQVLSFSDIAGIHPQMTAPDGGCLSRDETLLYVACNGTARTDVSGGIATFRTLDGAFLTFVPASEVNGLMGPDDLILDATGDFLYVSNSLANPAHIGRYNLNLQQVVQTYELSVPSHVTGYVEKMALSTCGDFLYAAAADPSGVSLPVFIISLNPQPFTKTITTVPDVCVNCNQVCINSSETRLYTVNYDNKGSFVEVMDISNPLAPEYMTHLPLGSNSSSYSIACNDQYLFITDTQSNEIYVLDAGNAFEKKTTLKVSGASYWSSRLSMVKFS